VKINIVHVPKPSTLDEVIASDDSNEIKKAQIKGIFLKMYSEALSPQNSTLTTVTNKFLDRIMEL
jgi:hypothetical protein